MNKSKLSPEMARIFQCFFAFTSVAGQSKTVSLEKCSYQLSLVFLRHSTTWRKRKLQNIRVPDIVRKVIAKKINVGKHFPVLMQDLSMRNYEEKETMLLHLEEIEQENNLKKYNMKKVKFRYDGEHFHLFVPTIQAGLLTILEDQKLIVQHSTKTDMPKYTARVISENNGMLKLAFSKKFCKQYDQDLPEWDVEFIYYRTSMLRCYNAVRLLQMLGKDALFPDQITSKPAQYKMKSSMEFFHSYLDKQQCSAVRNILAGEGRPAPYILFGPPGTGKTITIVEAILQILTKIPGSRILACAPSNSAVDVLAQKLHETGKVNPEIMARNYAKRQSLSENIPEDIKPYKHSDMSPGDVKNFRLLLSTCNSAAIVNEMGPPPGFYTHVFVDEAGQATEPDCIIPAQMLSQNGLLILSGDPHQLGPVVISHEARNYGLNTSFIQRLMSLHLYRRNKMQFEEYGFYNPQLITKLVNNYRSHPAILLPSSELFYENELQAEGSRKTTHSLSKWEKLPISGVPVLFHHVEGQEEIRDYTRSRKNQEEAFVVVDYVKKLFDTIEGLKEEDIGIITPYRLQVETIEEMISGLLYKKIDVGTVELFQGQERKIIIISTVRSSNKKVLGFLKDPERMNVSLTRAKALLIVIGNSEILSTDIHWGFFIRYCKRQGIYIREETHTEHEIELN